MISAGRQIYPDVATLGEIEGGESMYEFLRLRRIKYKIPATNPTW
jgi:hypothetical protein